MSLRDFLLDYAEKAPKAERIDRAGYEIRYGGPSGDPVPRCPLELASGIPAGGFLLAAWEYDLTDEERDLITCAADGEGEDPAEVWRGERAWRAVLEKLAEPEVRW